MTCENVGQTQKRNFPQMKVPVSKSKSIALICLLYLFDDEDFSKHKYRES